MRGEVEGTLDGLRRNAIPLDDFLRRAIHDVLVMLGSL
jgi:hypothetical protein